MSNFIKFNKTKEIHNVHNAVSNSFFSSTSNNSSSTSTASGVCSPSNCSGASSGNASCCGTGGGGGGGGNGLNTQFVLSPAIASGLSFGINASNEKSLLSGNSLTSTGNSSPNIRLASYGAAMIRNRSSSKTTINDISSPKADEMPAKKTTMTSMPSSSSSTNSYVHTLYKCFSSTASAAAASTTTTTTSTTSDNKQQSQTIRLQPPPSSLSLKPSTSFDTPSLMSKMCNGSFIDPSEIIHSISSKFVILVDCRTYNDYNNMHIKDSVHVNCRDNLTKKRLKSLKLTFKDLISSEEIKNKLVEAKRSLCKGADQLMGSVKLTRSNSNQNVATTQNVSKPSQEDGEKSAAVAQLESVHATPSHSPATAIEVDEEDISDASKNIIVLYDDTTNDLSELQTESNPLKILQENIKQCGYNEECKILKGGFKKFNEIYPNWCESKKKCESFKREVYKTDVCDLKQSDIDNARMNQITSFLYLGNEMDAKDEKKLVENSIYYILNVTKNIPFYTSVESNSKFVLKRIAVDDCGNQNLKQYFDTAIEFIEQARENNAKVLVHCQAGISRSPTIVIAYLMKKFNLKLDDAYSQVRSKRPIISPNLVFYSQLMDYESKINQQQEPPQQQQQQLENKQIISTTLTVNNEKADQEMIASHSPVTHVTKNIFSSLNEIKLDNNTFLGEVSDYDLTDSSSDSSEDNDTSNSNPPSRNQSAITCN